MGKYRLILSMVILCMLSSCNTYELMRYQNNGVDKVENAEKHKIYICDDKKVYKVLKPSITTSGLSGNIEPVPDPKEAQEIKSPSPAQLKKHRRDLDILTKKSLPDSAAKIELKKNEITGYNLVVSHSKINWKKVGEVIEAVLGIAVCLALIGALIYWLTFI